jgi:hypothetical protein
VEIRAQNKINDKTPHKDRNFGFLRGVFLKKWEERLIFEMGYGRMKKKAGGFL